MTVVIHTEKLGKQFHVAAAREKYRTFRESLVKAATAPFRRGKREGREERDFWALRDFDLDVSEGEVLGVIGHNGAGKSTLLKILSRITLPTTGFAEIRGRVGALLEVGTGFHPELTGRENVFLSGAILGMPRADIHRRFDEIVAFAGVERFIDTAIKHYSSGMQLRLAFAVAAHLEPEILLIDEVLAVGDAAFQQKCLGKMKDVSRTGRTVLFVSHNLQAVRMLCTKACLMESGQLKQIGDVGAVIRAYLDSLALHPAERASEVRSNEFVLRNVQIEQDGQKGAFLSTGELVVEIEYDLLEKAGPLLLGFDVHDSEGNQLFRTYDLQAAGLEPREPGRYLSTCVLPAGLFPAGTLYFNLLVGLHRQRWISRGEMSLKVDLDMPGASDVDVPGMFLPQGAWRVERETES